MKGERGCGMAGLSCLCHRKGEMCPRHRVRGELWRWPGKGCSWHGLQPPVASFLCPSKKPSFLWLLHGCLLCHGMASFASCSLWRELLPTSVSVKCSKCNPEASWDNHGKVSLRNLAFHYKYSKSLQVSKLWIFLSPFCSFVSIPCKVQLIAMKEQI